MHDDREKLVLHRALTSQHPNSNSMANSHWSRHPEHPTDLIGPRDFPVAMKTRNEEAPTGVTPSGSQGDPKGRQSTDPSTMEMGQLHSPGTWMAGWHNDKVWVAHARPFRSFWSR
jgi:hypothetical protein